MANKKPTQVPQYPRRSFRKEKATSDELFNKKKANLQSVENLKKRKPWLYKEWFAMAEAYKKPDHVKMIKQMKKHKEDNIRQGPDTSLFDPKYRNDSRNRAFKMNTIRGALKRGEDPRRDTVGGRQKTPIDRRKAYTYNQKDRPAKKPGVQKEDFFNEGDARSKDQRSASDFLRNG